MKNTTYRALYIKRLFTLSALLVLVLISITSPLLSLEEKKIDSILRSVLSDMGQDADAYSWELVKSSQGTLADGILITAEIKMQQRPQDSTDSPARLSADAQARSLSFRGWGADEDAATRDLYKAIAEASYQLIGDDYHTGTLIKHVKGERAIALVPDHSRIGRVFSMPGHTQAILMSRLADAPAKGKDKQTAANKATDRTADEKPILAMLAPIKGRIKTGMPVSTHPFPLQVALHGSYEFGKVTGADMSLALAYPVIYGLGIETRIGLDSIKKPRVTMLAGLNFGNISIMGWYLRPALLAGYAIGKDTKGAQANGFIMLVEAGIYHEIFAGLELGLTGAYKLSKYGKDLRQNYLLGGALRY